MASQDSVNRYPDSLWPSDAMLLHWSYTSVTSHSPAPYGLFPGCSRAVLNKNRTSTHGARTGPVRRRTNFAFPYEEAKCIISLRAPYRFRDCKQPVNSGAGDKNRTGHVVGCDWGNSQHCFGFLRDYTKPIPEMMCYCHLDSWEQKRQCNFNQIQTFPAAKKMYLKRSPAKWCPFCSGLNIKHSKLTQTTANLIFCIQVIC